MYMETTEEIAKRWIDSEPASEIAQVDVLESGFENLAIWGIDPLIAILNVVDLDEGNQTTNSMLLEIARGHLGRFHKALYANLDKLDGVMKALKNAEPAEAENQTPKGITPEKGEPQ